MTKAMANPVTVIGIALLTLGGCVQDVPGPTAQRTGSKTDENACLAAVAKVTQNSVGIISSDFSEANTTVMVGVGSQKAPWRCLVSGGRVADVMSMTDEGAL